MGKAARRPPPPPSKAAQLRANPRLKATDEQVRYAIEELGAGNGAAFLGVSKRTLLERRRQVEAREGVPVVSARLMHCSKGDGRYNYITQHQISPHRWPLTVPNGAVLIGGDCHYWPGHVPFMHRAFCLIGDRLRDQRQLKAVIMNGDVCDFGAISRWPVINWESAPQPKEEIEMAQDMLHEIAEACGKVEKLWPGGNHDLRFNNFIAQHAEKLRDIPGVHLKDHFPLWQPCWSVMINAEAGFAGATFVKHRIKGGALAIRNNVNQACTHVITNHLHAANVWMETKLPGTLYGVDSGCIADINGPQFLYLEDNPVSWREGFVVLTYDEGKLLPPDMVLRHPNKDDCVMFRGETIRVPK